MAQSQQEFTLGLYTGKTDEWLRAWRVILSGDTLPATGSGPGRARQNQIHRAGVLGRRLPGVVASFRLQWTDGEGGASWTSTLTAAAVPVGDHWTWMLPRARYALYRDDACTAGESPP